MNTRSLLSLIAAATLTLTMGAAANPAQSAGPSIQVAGFDLTRPEVVATGLQIPWGLAFLPDGSALVSERNSARVLRLRPGQAPAVVGTIPGVVPAGEAGLLGLAVSPTYASDGWIYAYHTASADNRIVRFQLATPGTVQVVRSGIPKANIHDGGRIAFGPDGMLYAGTGDANNTSNAQNLNTLAGKILRMTPTGGVPASGNPFANSVVYSYGHRNVQGLAWDGQGRMFATEFGQNTTDEVNQIVAGGNYGWPTCEGTCSNPSLRNPMVTWPTSQASPSGLAYANNTLFAAALRGTRLWLVPVGGGTPTSQLQGTYGRIRTVAVGPDGYLWIATSNRDGRGTPIATDDRVVRFPPESGGTVVFEDTFETNLGWVANPSGTDTATAGRFERGDPEAATSGTTTTQLGTTTSGVNCLVTGRLLNGSASANDLDGGVTSIRSPSIALPSGRTLTLSLRYYLAHLNNASNADYLRVRVNGTLVFERLGAASNVSAAWQTANINLTSFGGQTVTILVEAADAATGSVLEAAVDDVRIS
ncbi:PQQ-dependent sugar dehydrogenase [Allorhizocola rhizosphaerae]|uniref:PQQ-dependent sugar dehydrogenase n=1 Tax=Allorhizocola rhizosphaerae TaxID=1872709 RepID=UPI000E3D28D2|nr:PQQ-dependent sugar dehydrogenase [Allorhizocola rhizosphaerae]